MIEQTIEQKLTEVREFIENNRKGSDKPVFWQLFYGKSVTGTGKNWQKGDKNFDVADMETSIEMLNNAIVRTANQGHKALMISLRSSVNDSQGANFPFPNPNYKPGGQQNSIYGMPPTHNPNSIGAKDIIAMMQQMNQQQMNFMNQISGLQQKHLDYQRQVQIDKLKEELDAVRASKKANWINQILENQEVQGLIARLVGGSSGSETPYQEQEPQKLAEGHSDNDQQQELKRQQRELTSALERIKKLFPNISQFMGDLAAYMEKDPDGAKFLAQQMKRELNG